MNMSCECEPQQHNIVSSSNNVDVIDINVLKHWDLDALGFRCSNLLVDIIDTASEIDQNITNIRHRATPENENNFKGLLQRIINITKAHLVELSEINVLTNIHTDV